MLKGFFEFIFWLLSPVIFLLSGIVVSFLVQFVYYFLKGHRLKGKVPRVKRDGILKRLWFQFPNALVRDLYSRDPEEFQEYGLHLFCGEQGSGKTTAVVEMLQRWRQRYPKMKIISNMGFEGEDKSLTHWRDVLGFNNDKYGVAVVIDEVQTWFSSLESKDFPPEMITEISQQRKQRKAIVGTAQVFSRIAKPIREQATYIYLPVTLFGCLTVVRKTKSQWWDNERQRFKRYCGFYFFIHTNKIRSAFDTYRKIERYSKVGFKRPCWLDDSKM